MLMNGFMKVQAFSTYTFWAAGLEETPNTNEMFNLPIKMLNYDLTKIVINKEINKSRCKEKIFWCP